MVIQDWVSVIVGSLQNLWVAAVGVLGDIVGALIVLIVGLIVASGLGALVERVIAAVKLDKLLMSLGIEEYFERAGISINSGKFLGRLVYWFLVVVFLLAATDILGLFTLSSFLRDVAAFIGRNVIGAVLIMLAAVVVGNFLRNVVKASVKSAKLHAASFLGSLTWWAIVIFGFFAALSQLGIAVSILNSIVTGFVAMLAIAGGIAFGLGGKDYAMHLIGKLREHTER
ncbi:hypothetical protein A2116_00995 [Candidatus Jorgensenbacteria bacterium GWA1_49_17]|uniref:Small-conductance mechanosensitive ion channel n=2 Tax=Candidatus Joergenseniibacteriota TaxID=1752739 RepID=A0A1F6BM71_9BACT|nr:MAG: hypothetical protein A2127_01795 [Candidatus Jorgensenbacteria bacterium GWC1_48_12]OGG40304.1 MAG: hypothetical protein A2116_00995 [Candidatus Jorgensenbacteria bacterium GWA1_49_17]